MHLEHNIFDILVICFTLLYMFSILPHNCTTVLLPNWVPVLGNELHGFKTYLCTRGEAGVT